MAQAITGFTSMFDGMETVIVPERLDSASASLFEQEILNRIIHGSHHLVLDCREIRFMTAAGLRVILAGLRAAKSVEGSLTLSNISGQPRAMIVACGFDHFIPMRQENAETGMRIVG